MATSWSRSAGPTRSGPVTPAGSAPRRSSTRSSSTPHWPRPTGSSRRGPAGSPVPPGRSPSWSCAPRPGTGWPPSRDRSSTAREAGRRRGRLDHQRRGHAHPLDDRCPGPIPAREGPLAPLVPVRRGRGVPLLRPGDRPRRRSGLHRADPVRRATGGDDVDLAAGPAAGRGARAGEPADPPLRRAGRQGRRPVDASASAASPGLIRPDSRARDHRDRDPRQPRRRRRRSAWPAPGRCGRTAAPRRWP